MAAPIVWGIIAVAITALGSGFAGYVSGTKTASETVQSASTAGGVTSFAGSLLGGSLGTILLWATVGFLLVRIVLSYLGNDR